MSTPDDFESEGGDIATVGGTNPKYYQVAVPDFPFGGTATPGGATSGNSFVRLGSFPGLTDSVPGLQNSVSLAGLVGNVARIEAQDLAAETDGGVNQFNTALPDSFLVGFADDTRHRDAKPTKSERQAETKNLLTKGGWWDHADGNRITTTTGDKIEVIQGNYKMVVLGRQPPTDYTLGNVFITDVSGGYFQEQNACPTPCIKTVEYTKADGVWTLFQDNGKGNVVTRFEGQQLDYFIGSKKEAYVGQNYEGTVSDSDKLPNVISKTWAKKIESYTGSSDKPVPRIEAITYADVTTSWTKADRVQSDTIAKAVTTTTTAANITNVTTAAFVWNFNHAINNFTFTLGIQESINIGAILDVQLGPKSSVNVEWMQFNGFKHVVTGQKADATASEQKLTAIKDSITAAKNELDGKVTKVAGDLTELDGKAVKLGVTYSAIFSQINLV